MKRDDPALAELPMENYGYQFFVGDYHPPLAGFFLLALAIALIMALETSGAAVCRRTTLAQQAMLAFTVPAAIAANTWVYPLQLAMVGGWALWRQREAHGHRARGPAWFALAAGAGIGFALLFPFLSAFAARAVPTTLALVKIHSPFLPFVALMWPLLLLIGCGLLRKDTPRPTLFFTLLTAGLLLLSELVYIDDPSAGRYERTNTVMKWWGWIWTGGLIALGPPLLGAKQAWIRGATALAIGATLVYGVDIAHYFHATDMRFKGQLAGDGAYTEVPPVRDMFRYLGAVPDGIVLENVYGDAYHDGGAYAAFAAKPSLLGWTAHLRAWRGLDIEEIPQRAAQIRAFYRGDMPNPAAWLQTSDVRYVVWSVREAPDTAAWQRLASALEEDYAWHPFGHVGGQPVGIWVRR